MATFFPTRSFTEPIPGLATSASLSPIRSWIHTTLYGMFSGADRPLVTGLDPARPRSTDPAMTAVLTSPPDSNFTHFTSTSGSACSSSFWFFTTRSALGIAW